MENFREIAEQFRQAGALVEVKDGDELGREIVALLCDETRRRTLGARAASLLDQNRGAVVRTVEALAGLLGR
jgi:3-deoxy-D-manno-octulosonic-acid transferase